MNDDICQVFRLLDRLLRSCATYDISVDVFMSPADPEAYHAALEGIRDTISRIRDLGISRDELTETASTIGISETPLPDLTLSLEDLVPLILPEFNGWQETMIWSACEMWGRELTPDDPDATAMMIRSGIAARSLPDLFDPVVTRMQRFPVILALETATKVPIPGSIPFAGTEGRVLLVPTGDPVLFAGQIHPAIFALLVRRGILPDPFFPELVFQALADIGIFYAGGSDAIERIFTEGNVPAGMLYSTGRSLCLESGAITDIRTLLSISLGDRGSAPVNPVAERLSGHVLAGAITAQGKSAIRLALDFITTVACRSSGRIRPDARAILTMERTIQEHEQLLRAVSGAYTWGAVPLPLESCGFRPIVDLWPDRHRMLYDPEAIASLSPAASRALVMEAYYCHKFQPDIAGADLPQSPWMPRLARILLVSRAWKKGFNLHPGVIRWLGQLTSDRYSPAACIADSARIDRFPLPDQFLEGLLFEARTGTPALHIRNGAIRYALVSTSEPRNVLVECPDTEFYRIIRERIWPVFEEVCIPPATNEGVKDRNVPGFDGSAANPPFTPHGKIEQQDKAVPSPLPVSGPVSGRTMNGRVDSLAEEGGLALPPGSPGAMIPQESSVDSRQIRPGSGGRSAPAPSSEIPGEGSTSSGISAAAGALMDACRRSRELLESLSIPSGSGGSDRHLTDASGNRDKNAVELDLLTQQIADVAKRLEQEVRRLQGPGNPEKNLSSRFCKELDSLLKASEKIRKVSMEYQEMGAELKRRVKVAGAGSDAIGQLSGLTRDILDQLEAAGAEFQRLTGASEFFRADSEIPVIRLSDVTEEPGSADGKPMRGKMDPAFAADNAYSPDVWENFSYFDATFDENPLQANTESCPASSQRDHAGRQEFDQVNQALTREAEQYLDSLKQRTRSEWETMDEKAERIRRIALFESHEVSRNDFTTYQRFYQPVAGLIIVARKNIQQALQKSQANRDLNELATGDDIDEENLAAVRTTMRIFRDRGREPDRTRWCLSLLIDASSSMHDETIAKKLQAAIQAAILFGEAVNHIQGIRFEIAAFSDIEYIPLKRYQDEWNIHQGCYLIREVVRANGGTNDVGAVSSALDRMNRLRLAAGASRMILVISDGQSGVGGREQMRTIVKTNKNTRIFGWGIGPDMEQIEETYLPYGTWVPDIAELPRSIGAVLRRELGRPAMAGWKEGKDSTGDTRLKPGKESCTN